MFHYFLSLFSFHFLLIFFHFLSVFFHFLFIFLSFYFLSFSFSFIFCLSFSFSFFFLSGAQNLIFFCASISSRFLLTVLMLKNQFLSPSQEVPLWAPLFLFCSFFSPVFFLAFTSWLPFGYSVKIRLRVEKSGRRVGQVLPSYQNRQISALDETADAPQSGLSSLLLSCLCLSSFVFSSLFLCLLPLSLSVSLSLSPCDVVCVCVLRHTEKTWKKPVYTFKKRPRLCRHHAHTCFNTCARGAGTHGDVLNVHTGAGGHRQFCLPKFAHVWSSRASEVHQKTFQSFPFSSLRIDSDRHVTDSSNHSLYLIRLFSFSNLDGICGPDGSISLPPLSPQPRAPQQHTTHNTQRLRQRHRDRDKERRQNQVLRTIHTSDTFHDVLLKMPLTFHNSFTFFLPQRLYSDINMDVIVNRQ